MSSRSVLVLYGSETGHSEEIAREIGDTAERLRLEASVEEMNDVALVSQAYLFRVSTPSSGIVLTKQFARTERAKPALSRRLCDLNNWSGRHARKCRHLLEELATKEIAANLPQPPTVYHIWAW